MAKLFDDCERIVPTWLAAARHLNKLPGRTAMNLVLEIRQPLALTSDDRAVMARVDAALLRRGLSLRRVAATIFPLDTYRRFGRPNFYDEYLRTLVRGKTRWGTYAQRMIDRPGRQRGARVNALELLVTRLSECGQPTNPSGGRKSVASAYELGVTDPELDLQDSWSSHDDGGDVPTYDVAVDGRKWLGFACLSHLSFKRVQIGDRTAVNLTAMYRSHHYCSRGLGNLLGLAQLLSFVAKETKLAVGTLTCLSTHAELDVDKWGGVQVANHVLAEEALRTATPEANFSAS